MQFGVGQKTAIVWIMATGAAAMLLALATGHMGWDLAVTIPWLCLAMLLYMNSPLITSRLRAGNGQSKPDSRDTLLVYKQTTEALASAIASKDHYEQHHVKRVRTICEMIAKKLRLDQSTTDGITIAALLHDVGKLGVPEYILLKPGPLDPEEFSKIANHASIGAQILESVDYPWNVSEMVRHHHERYDGTGYPDHLSGEQIPLGSRIIAVAEVYDALVSDRCYKTGWSHLQAIEHIEKLSRAHLDPKIVSAFMQIQAEVACLNTGDSGVRAVDPEKSDSPGAADLIAQANRELVSLLEIAETISSTLELDEVLELLAHRTRRLSEACTCAVFLIDENHPDELVSRVSVGRYQDCLIGARVNMGKGITGKAASRMKPFVGAYDPTDLFAGEAAKLTPELKSCVVVPIVMFGSVLGTINLYDDGVRSFSQEDVQTLMSVASRAAVAIQNASAFEQVRDSAMKDCVTDLYNGRYLRSYLEHEISRAARHEEELSILGMDLENFKVVNDTFGHSRGDAVLKDMAVIFQRQLRDYDLVVRNGGDEFVAVLTQANAAEAARTAKRIQAEVESYARRNLKESDPPLGVSIGVASYPADGTDSAALLAFSDAAMYRDKRARKQERLAA